MRVTGCFPRDRVRRQAFPLPPTQVDGARKRHQAPLGPMEKLESTSIRGSFRLAGVGAIITDLHGGRIAPREK
jgi:hypothetical protein